MTIGKETAALDEYTQGPEAEGAGLTETAAELGQHRHHDRAPGQRRAVALN